MSQLRRVVTGHDAAGRSTFVADTEVESFEIPGMSGTEILTLWGADETLRFPDAGGHQDHETFFPPVGGFRFLQFSIPPDRDLAEAPAEVEPGALEQRLPGLAETMDPEAPGMHRSATVDLLYVASGACRLELDDGSSRILTTGDTAVQNGTMHRWSNPFDSPCHVIAVTVGAVITNA